MHGLAKVPEIKKKNCFCVSAEVSFLPHTNEPCLQQQEISVYNSRSEE